MSANVLGKNIRYMRKMRGEKLDELASVLNVTKSAVSDYESGRRIPNPEIIKVIAKHYGKTVDELLNTLLYELENFDPATKVDVDEMMGVFLHILPLVESKEAYSNNSFSAGMGMIKEMLLVCREGGVVEGTVISDTFECFSQAAEDNVYEASANLLWCIFFLWHQQYTDVVSVQRFQTRLLSQQVDWKEMMYETKKEAKKTADKRKSFVEDFDEILKELILQLKQTEQWASLGDYYLALRYVFGMVNTGNSDELNQVIGMQMMMAFAQIDNTYATNFLQAGDYMQ